MSWRRRPTSAVRAVRAGLTGTRARRLYLGLGMTAVALAGAVLGVLLAGRVQQDVGPFRAEFSMQPAVTGGTDVKLPPVGALQVRSHAGPHVTIDLAALDNARTRRLVTNPNGVAEASQSAITDLGHGLSRLVLQAAAAGLLGAMVLAALVFRSTRRVAICGGLSLAIMAAALGTAGLTFRRQALAEPKYEGLLTNARVVVGDARRIADQYDAYRDQLQRMVINVSRLYTTISTLPVYEPPSDTMKVLHISDLHLNPSAWAVIHTVVEQFDIDLVVDTGDITDWGSEPERSYVAEIGRLGVPYVFVRGNHDSASTAAAVKSQPNAVVLDNTVADVEGLRIAGIGDPRFTPDKSAAPNDPINAGYVQEGLRLSGQKLAGMIKQYPAKVDLALVHDPASAEPLAGVTPLVLAGHRHERTTRDLLAPDGSIVDRTLLMVEGSTGGAGLRGLESDSPVPLELSVLYLGADHALQAYDEVSVGGTGQAEVTLERHLIPAPTGEATEQPAAGGGP
jgi:hypothetical protein